MDKMTDRKESSRSLSSHVLSVGHKKHHLVETEHISGDNSLAVLTIVSLGWCACTHHSHKLTNVWCLLVFSFQGCSALGVGHGGAQTSDTSYHCTLHSVAGVAPCRWHLDMQGTPCTSGVNSRCSHAPFLVQLSVALQSNQAVVAHTSILQHLPRCLGECVHRSGISMALATFTAPLDWWCWILKQQTHSLFGQTAPRRSQWGWMQIAQQPGQQWPSLTWHGCVSRPGASVGDRHVLSMAETESQVCRQGELPILSHSGVWHPQVMGSGCVVDQGDCCRRSGRRGTSDSGSLVVQVASTAVRRQQDS